MQLEGQALPCSVVSVSGAIVVVKFEVQSSFTLPRVTMPLFGPEYIRYPIQQGDKGFAVPADARLGGISGLGGGVADLNQPNNLAALVFLPIGSKDWTTVDPNAVTIYGPNGVVLRDTGSNCIITLTPSQVTIVVPDGGYLSLSNGACYVNLLGNQLTLSAAQVNIEGVLVINGQPWLTHAHSNVMEGTDDSGGVVV
jgi:hypothetical protein